MRTGRFVLARCARPNRVLHRQRARPPRAPGAAKLTIANKIKYSFQAAAFSLGALACIATFAQEYPTKPVRLVVGFPPGGSNDLLARQLSPKLSELLGVNFIVENRPGANAILGTDHVAKSAPDGYTLGLAGMSPLIIASYTYAKMPYDSTTDLAGITLVAMNPLLLVVHPALPARSLKEFVALAKAQPNKLDFATAGAGGSTRMLIELMKFSTGVQVQTIHYKGAGPALTELLGGHVQGMVMDFPVLYPPVKSGKLRALAITSEKRSPLLPDTATVAEQGVPAMQAVNWYAIVAPAKTPRAIIDKLHCAITKAATAPDVRDKFITAGSEPLISASPEALSAFIKQETVRWGKVAKFANIRVE